MCFPKDVFPRGVPSSKKAGKEVPADMSPGSRKRFVENQGRPVNWRESSDI